MTEHPKRYRYIQDPGHGWLAVPISDLAAVHYGPNDFSAYSYRKGDVAYLEEDCDMPKFMEQYRRLHAVYPTLDSQHVESTPIRGYRRLSTNPQPSY